MEDHPDAMEIYRRAIAIDPTMSLSTVYRTMKLLEGFGAIHRHAFEGGPSRFENASGEHHDHLIDIETGDVIEFKSDRIEQLQNEIARELGYDIVHHRLELYGRRRKVTPQRLTNAPAAVNHRRRRLTRHVSNDNAKRKRDAQWETPTSA